MSATTCSEDELFLKTAFESWTNDLQSQQEEAKAAEEAAEAAEEAACRAENAARRKKRHAAARRKKLRPGETACWECCTPQRHEGELDENSDGEEVIYCVQCWRLRNDCPDSDDDGGYMYDSDDSYGGDPRRFGYL